MRNPPLFAGAVNAMLAWLVPGVADVMVGAPGAVAVMVKLCSTWGAAL